MLKVWLPLNGDLHNQGISEITFSGTSTWQNFGKIGSKAYNLSTRTSFNCPALANVKYFSVAFWCMIEPNTESTANWMDILSLTDKSINDTTGYFRFETGYGNTAQGGIHWHDNATNAIINGSYTYNTASEQHQWHHIVVTVSNTAVCSYYDGVLKQTHTSNLGGGHLTGAGWIGESTTRGSIQDIRIYDHCLSAAEVKEIAQGLVLHYKLDSFQGGSGSSTIIQDSSGYNHNGTILGNPTLSSDTIRYSSCTNFPENTDGILSTFPVSLWNNAFTYSFWIKPSGENGGRSIYAASYNGTSCSIEKTTGNKLRFYWSGSPDLTTSSLTIVDGVWQHIAIVKSEDKTKVYCYYNGELKDTFTNTFSDKAFNGNLRIARDTRGDATSYTGLMSDFRIYCTPLLDTDIKQLYNVGMKIDKNHNIHCFEICENETDTNIQKTGVLNTLSIYENAYQNLLQYDKTLHIEPDGSIWAHVFHHNNPTNSKFSNTNIDWTDGIYIDEDRWYDLDTILNSLPHWEFLHIQKTTASATETKYRWSQKINPLLATWATVGTDYCSYKTSADGYNNSSFNKGIYLLKSTQLHMCIANASNGNWYGGIGVASAYNGGIPGYPNTTVTTGCIDLYIRVDTPVKILKDRGISTQQFIER